MDSGPGGRNDEGKRAIRIHKEPSKGEGSCGSGENCAGIKKGIGGSGVMLSPMPYVQGDLCPDEGVSL